MLAMMMPVLYRTSPLSFVGKQEAWFEAPNCLGLVVICQHKLEHMHAEKLFPGKAALLCMNRAMELIGGELLRHKGQQEIGVDRFDQMIVKSGDVRTQAVARQTISGRCRNNHFPGTGSLA
jgi:hypothetical protein